MNRRVHSRKWKAWNVTNVNLHWSILHQTSFGVLPCESGYWCFLPLPLFSFSLFLFFSASSSLFLFSLFLSLWLKPCWLKPSWLNPIWLKNNFSSSFSMDLPTASRSDWWATRSNDTSRSLEKKLTKKKRVSRKMKQRMLGHRDARREGVMPTVITVHHATLKAQKQPVQEADCRHLRDPKQSGPTSADGGDHAANGDVCCVSEWPTAERAETCPQSVSGHI